MQSSLIIELIICTIGTLLLIWILSWKKVEPKFEELDCVTLLIDAKGVPKGTLGTIVHVYMDGIAFEVEFPEYKAVIQLTKHDITHDKK